MANIDKNRLEEFSTRWDTVDYILYVKNGEPVEIRDLQATGAKRNFYNNENNYTEGFFTEFLIVVCSFCKNNDVKSLKKLYNSLDKGLFKECVEKNISDLIDFYKNAIAYLSILK